MQAKRKSKEILRYLLEEIPLHDSNKCEKTILTVIKLLQNDIYPSRKIIKCILYDNLHHPNIIEMTKKFVFFSINNDTELTNPQYRIKII